MNFIQSFKAYAQSPKLMQPRNGSLNDPPMDSQATPMLGESSREHRLNMTCSQLAPMRIRIVTTVSLHSLGTTTRSSTFAAQCGDGFDQRQQLGHIIDIRTRQRRGQGNALRVRQDVVFAPRFASVCRVTTCFFPPSIARTELLSTTARDQSIWSAIWSFSKSTRCKRCQTPARSHSRKCRQQVIPEPHPISCGNNSHGIPVFKTNRIPVRAFRLSIGFRPGWCERRGLFGSKGSIKFHSSSSTKGLAIHVPFQVDRHIIPNLIPFC